VVFNSLVNVKQFLFTVLLFLFKLLSMQHCWKAADELTLSSKPLTDLSHCDLPFSVIWRYSLFRGPKFWILGPLVVLPACLDGAVGSVAVCAAWLR